LSDPGQGTGLHGSGPVISGPTTPLARLAQNVGLTAWSTSGGGLAARRSPQRPGSADGTERERGSHQCLGRSAASSSAR
jgi:hypothetical protein